MTDVIDSDGFRANVGIILMRPQAATTADGGGELFLGGRPNGGGWQFPQGGIRKGEKLEQALYRELGEEIGLAASDVQILGSTHSWVRYRLPTQYRRRSKPLCIGQKQRWFLLRYLGDEDRFRFDSTDEPEFDRWRWVDYWQPVREVIYFKRRSYERALHELAAFAPGGLPPYPDWWEERTETPARAR